MKKQSSFTRSTVQFLLPVLILAGIYLAAPVGANTGDVVDVAPAVSTVDMVGVGLYH